MSRLHALMTVALPLDNAFDEVIARSTNTNNASNSRNKARFFVHSLN